MKQYGLDHSRYKSASEVGRDLRRLGYDVSARRRQPWHVTPRDRLELVEFARDYKQAHGVEIVTVPACTQFLDALARASANPAQWTLDAAHELQCCHKCHFDFEELRVFPFLDRKARAKLQRAHDELREDPDLDELRRHAANEVIIFRDAGVPKRLIESVEADHRALLPKARALHVN